MSRRRGPHPEAELRRINRAEWFKGRRQAAAGLPWEGLSSLAHRDGYNEERDRLARQEGRLPRYKHDCKGCLFLGRYKDIDLWWCKNPSMRTLDSLIGRYGHKGHEYYSSHPPGCFSHPVDEENGWYGAILRLAKQNKYIYDPETQGFKPKPPPRGWEEDLG